METILEGIQRGGRASAAIAIPMPPRAGAAAGLLLNGSDRGEGGVLRHAQSFVDCESVLRSSAVTVAKPAAAPLAAALGPRAADLLQGQQVTAVQEDEDQMAQVRRGAWGARGPGFGPDGCAYFCAQPGMRIK
jgi:hypothetical protein